MAVAFSGGVGSATFGAVPCGTYTAMGARDRLHTLRRVGTSMPVFDGTDPGNLVATFTSASGAALRGGNINDDGFIDILDFGGYIGRLGQSPGADTACATPALHADFSGNGSIGAEDFTFIQSNFLAAGEPDACAPLAGDGPVTDISVADLIARGDWDIARGDLNMDGRLNGLDVAFLAVNGPPACRADFNGVGGVTVQDVFDFINAWMAGHPAADVDDDRRVTVPDIFGFLSMWFAGCP